jgi:hypothetical protein
MIRSPFRKSSVRLLALGAVLLAGGALVVSLLSRAPAAENRGIGEDFIEYWAATRLNLAGANPYNSGQMLALQRATGWLLPDPRMMWNPPHLMALVTPFSFLDYGLALLLWRILILIGVLACVGVLWQFYGGRSRTRLVSIYLALVFLPMVLSVAYGQIDFLILVGLTGFLVCEARHRDLEAGAFLALVSVKPQLLPIFFLALLLWVIDRKRWRILLGAVAALLALSLLAMIPNPGVLGQYIRAVGNDPVGEWITPTFGALLRLLFGWNRFGLQFVPLIFGIVWLLWYWPKKRRSWTWRDQAPVLLFASLLVSPYGWIHDQILLLVPLVAVTAQCASRRVLALALVAYAVIFAVAFPGAKFAGLVRPAPTLAMPTQVWNVWMVPAWMLWWLAFGYIIRRASSDKER